MSIDCPELRELIGPHPACGRNSATLAFGMIVGSCASTLTAMDPVVARKMHRTLEPYHGLVYLVPEAADAYSRIGLREGRMGYFASRAAPMGPVPADVVIATFFNFQPDLVRASIPEAWSLASVDAILEARLALVDTALRRILGDDVVRSSEVVEAERLARLATEGCTPEGRPLYAGHASLAYPDEPHLALWHSLSLLREFRGDGHIAALVAAENDGCDAIVMHVASGELPKAFAATRAWSDTEWAASQEKLRTRGWLGADNDITDAGRESRQWVEDRTDQLALRCWERLGDDRAQRLRTLVRPLSKAIADVVFAELRAPNG